VAEKFETADPAVTSHASRGGSGPMAPLPSRRFPA
jgi:hypothetical protein